MKHRSEIDDVSIRKDVEVRPCDDCGEKVAVSAMVRTCTVDLHRLEFDDGMEMEAARCPSCAETERSRRQWGDPQPHQLKAIEHFVRRDFGDGLEVLWLQGDEHRAAVQIAPTLSR